MSDTFYDYTDKALKYLRRFYIREFNKAESQLRTDDLNVIQVTTNLYDRLRKETIKVFLRIARQKYKECGGDTLAEMWLLGFLGKSNPLTGYIWLNDVDRKRQYYTESIMSGGSIEKETKKARREFYGAVKEYADLVTFEAAVQAFTDTGAQYVEWITAVDERVCEVCGSRHGRKYRIDNVPRIPHYNCRCYLRRV